MKMPRYCWRCIATRCRQADPGEMISRKTIAGLHLPTIIQQMDVEFPPPLSHAPLRHALLRRRRMHDARRLRVIGLMNSRRMLLLGARDEQFPSKAPEQVADVVHQHEHRW